MTAVESMVYPAWLVPTLLGVCGLLLTVCAALLGALFKIYLDDRRQNALEHARLADEVKEAKAEVKEVKAEVKEVKAEVKEVKAEVNEVKVAVADLSVAVGRIEGHLLGPRNRADSN